MRIERCLVQSLTQCRNHSHHLPDNSFSMTRSSGSHQEVHFISGQSFNDKPASMDIPSISPRKNFNPQLPHVPYNNLIEWKEMFLLICVKTTFLKHLIIGLKSKRLMNFPELALCMSFDFSSDHILAHTECSQELGFFFFFLLWILLGLCNSLDFLCLCSSDLEHEIPNCSEHSNIIFRVHPYISSFILCTFPPSLCPSIHPSFQLKYPSQSRNGSAKCSLIMWCKNL